jgi:hypothetical protein
LTKTLDFRPYTDKGQTRPLVREGALIRQDRNFQRVNKHLVYWLTDRQSQSDSDSDCKTCLKHFLHIHYFFSIEEYFQYRTSISINQASIHFTDFILLMSLGVIPHDLLSEYLTSSCWHVLLLFIADSNCTNYYVFTGFNNLIQSYSFYLFHVVALIFFFLVLYTIYYSDMFYILHVLWIYGTFNKLN